MAAPNSISVFEGAWRLERCIAHHGAGEDRLSGEVIFRRSGQRLILDENGVLMTAGGAEMTATRRYVWEQIDRRIDIRFKDMRPFHSIPLGVSRPEATYLCSPDRYEVSYDFSGWPRWQSVWRVEGPRKDYTMTSIVSPAD